MELYRSVIQLKFFPGYIEVIHGWDTVLRATYHREITPTYVDTPASNAYLKYVEGDFTALETIKPLYHEAGVTEFQRRVYDAAREIPPGETRTYKEIAMEIGVNSPRAVGQALKRNPFLILIPCHRVTSKNGLGGFTSEGGKALKKALLDHEKKHI